MNSRHYALRTGVLIVLMTITCACLTWAADTASADTDKRVTVQFKDVAIKDAIDSLFQGRGLSYSLDQAVQGTVTANLMNVTFDTALTRIIKDANLTVTKEGGIYRIAPQKDTASEAAVEPNVIVSSSEVEIAPEKIPEKIFIGYANVQDIADILGGKQTNLYGGMGGMGMGGMGMGGMGMGGMGMGGNYGGQNSYGNRGGGSGYGNTGNYGGSGYRY